MLGEARLALAQARRRLDRQLDVVRAAVPDKERLVLQVCAISGGIVAVALPPGWPSHSPGRRPPEHQPAPLRWHSCQPWLPAWLPAHHPAAAAAPSSRRRTECTCLIRWRRTTRFWRGRASAQTPRVRPGLPQPLRALRCRLLCRSAVPHAALLAHAALLPPNATHTFPPLPHTHTHSQSRACLSLCRRRPAARHCVCARHPRRRLCHVAAGGRAGARPGACRSSAAVLASCRTGMQGVPCSAHSQREGIAGNCEAGSCPQGAAYPAGAWATASPGSRPWHALPLSLHSLVPTWPALLLAAASLSCPRQARESLDRPACWPASWVAKELPEARLLSLEYAAPASGWEVRRRRRLLSRPLLSPPPARPLVDAWSAARRPHPCHPGTHAATHAMHRRCRRCRCRCRALACRASRFPSATS